MEVRRDFKWGFVYLLISQDCSSADFWQVVSLVFARTILLILRSVSLIDSCSMNPILCIVPCHSWDINLLLCDIWEQHLMILWQMLHMSRPCLSVSFHLFILLPPVSHQGALTKGQKSPFKGIKECLPWPPVWLCLLYASSDLVSSVLYMVIWNGPYWVVILK